MPSLPRRRSIKTAVTLTYSTCVWQTETSFDITEATLTDLNGKFRFPTEPSTIKCTLWGHLFEVTVKLTDEWLKKASIPDGSCIICFETMKLVYQGLHWDAAIEAMNETPCYTDKKSFKMGFGTTIQYLHPGENMPRSNTCQENKSWCTVM